MCEEDEPAVIWATTANGEAHVLYGMSKPGVVYSNRQKSKFLFFLVDDQVVAVMIKMTKLIYTHEENNSC
jgi:hypothetical protein